MKKSQEIVQRRAVQGTSFQFFNAFSNSKNVSPSSISGLMSPIVSRDSVIVLSGVSMTVHKLLNVSVNVLPFPVHCVI